MRQFFSPQGISALANVMARRPLLAFDFDGTLAPIVARPDDARVPLTVAWRLECLAGILPLAIVSGRGVEDVRARLDFAPRFIIGSHGAEDPLDPAPAARSAVFNPVRDRLGRCAADLEQAGVLVEDKLHSMALHYRLARDRKRALELIRQVAAGFGPEVRTFNGKMVVNVVAAQAPDKADAVAVLVKRTGAQSAVFTGDDVNDEPVFERADASWLTIRVGRENPHSRARFCIDSFGEVASMLDRMLLLADGLKS